MALINLPKNPKAEDLVPVLTALDVRITALEAYVIRNDQRITALEKNQAKDAAGLAAHQSGATERQAEINQLRWALAHGRRTPRKG